MTKEILTFEEFKEENADAIKQMWRDMYQDYLKDIEEYDRRQKNKPHTR